MVSVFATIKEKYINFDIKNLSNEKIDRRGVIRVVAIASFGLSLFSIWLFDYLFGFNPIIGSVGLIGVALNDSIVVLSAIYNHP